jgi:hypothetical protein
MNETDLAISAAARARMAALNDETVTFTAGTPRDVNRRAKISPDDGFGTADTQLVCNATVFHWQQA